MSAINFFGSLFVSYSPTYTVSMKKLTLVRASGNDASTLALILTGSTRIKLDHGDNSWGSEPYTEEEAKQLIESHPTYLAYRDTEAVGTVTLQWEDESIWGSQGPDAGYIHRLAIKDGYKGQGIGEEMLGWADEQAVQNNRRFLRLDCDANNTSLCAYYQKQGFVKVGEKHQDKGHTSALFERHIKSLS